MKEDEARAEQLKEEKEQRAAEEAENSKNEQEEVADNVEVAPASNVASSQSDESHFINYPPPAPAAEGGIPDDAFGVGSPSFDFSNYDGPPEELEEWMIRVAMRMSLAQQQ